MATSDARSLNLAFWEERAPVHAQSPDYEFDSFMSDAHHLSPTVTFDRELLGDISGLDCIHLQCHLGTDSLSLARIGAGKVTGLDFSAASVEKARSLALATVNTGGSKLEYVAADIYQAWNVVPQGHFDLVYTGVGSLCWISNIAKWAAVVAGLLKPGGRLFMREAHPILWTLDQSATGVNPILKHTYFEQRKPYEVRFKGSYVQTDHKDFKTSVTMQYNHGMAEIIQALVDAGMCITGLKDHDTLPWEHVPGQMVQATPSEWALATGPERMPLSYTLQAVKQ